MHTIDAAASRFDCVEILGISALFTVERINRATVPEKLFAYDMQTSEDDWSIPCLIGRHITVEHYGTVITASPIPLPDTGYPCLGSGGLSRGCVKVRHLFCPVAYGDAFSLEPLSASGSEGTAAGLEREKR